MKFDKYYKDETEKIDETRWTAPKPKPITINSPTGDQIKVEQVNDDVVFYVTDSSTNMAGIDYVSIVSFPKYVIGEFIEKLQSFN